MKIVVVVAIVVATLFLLVGTFSLFTGAQQDGSFHLQSLQQLGICSSMLTQSPDPMSAAGALDFCDTHEDATHLPFQQPAAMSGLISFAINNNIDFVWLPLQVVGGIFVHKATGYPLSVPTFAQFFPEEMFDGSVLTNITFNVGLRNGHMELVDVADMTTSGAAVCRFNSPCNATTHYRESSSGACLPVNECVEGVEYELSAPSPISNRVCSNLTVCEVGTSFEIIAPTLSTDRQCAPTTNCSSTLTYIHQQATAESDNVCTTATQCDLQSQYESKQLTATSDRVCSLLTFCEEGYYEQEPPTETSDRQCAQMRPCVLGNNSTYRVGAVCIPITTCPNDQFQVAPHTSTQTAQCAPYSKMCDGTTNFETVAPSPYHDRICSPVTSCNPYTEIEIATPTFTSDRECGTKTAPSCPSGTYLTVDENSIPSCSILDVEPVVVQLPTSIGKLHGCELCFLYFNERVDGQVLMTVLPRDSPLGSVVGAFAFSPGTSPSLAPSFSVYTIDNHAEFLRSSGQSGVTLQAPNTQLLPQVSSNTIGFGLVTDLSTSQGIFVRVSMKGTQAECKTASGSYEGGCVTTLNLIIAVSDVNNWCPLNHVGSPEQIFPNIHASWTSPVMRGLDFNPLIFFNFTLLTIAEGDSNIADCPFGSYEYFFDASVLFNGESRCQFSVVITNLVHEPISRIGHDFISNDIGRANSLDFVVDAHFRTASNAFTHFRGLVNNVIGLGFSFDVTKGESLTLSTVPGGNCRFSFHLQFCEIPTDNINADVLVDESKFDALDTHLHLEDSNTQRQYALTMDSVTSWVRTDVNCFQLSGHTKPIDLSSITFQNIILSAHHRNSTAAHTAFGVNATDYFGVEDNFLVYEVEEDFTIDPGNLLTIKDVQPPRFLSCPIVFAKGGYNNVFAPAFWVPPTAEDNVDGDVLVRSASKPGDLFSVAQGVHKVEYIASDSQGNEAMCVVNIIMLYDTVKIFLQVQVDFTGILVLPPTETTLTPNLVERKYKDSIVRSDLLPFELFNANIQKSNSITLRVLPPIGEVLQVNVQNPKARARFYLDFTIVRVHDGDNATTVRDRFEDEQNRVVELGVLAKVEHPSYVTLEQQLQSSWVQDAECTMKIIDGVVETIHVKGRSSNDVPHLLTLNALLIEINYPGLFHIDRIDSSPFGYPNIDILSPNPNDTNSYTYTLTPDSDAGLEYSYIDHVDDTDYLNEERHDFLAFSDDVPPTFGDSCPSTVVHVSPPANSRTFNATWAVPVATDNRRVKKLTCTQEPPLLMMLDAHGNNEPIAIVCTAKDDYGLTSDCVYQLQAVDNTPPIVSCPDGEDGPQVLVLGESRSTYTLPDSPQDMLDAPVTDQGDIATVENGLLKELVYSHSSFGVGSHNLTVSATDTSGNTASCTFDVDVIDTQPPMFVYCPSIDRTASVTNDETDSTATVSWADITAEDNDELVSIRGSHSSGDSFPVGTTSVVYEAMDVSGNTAICSFNVTVSLQQGSSNSDGSSTDHLAGTVVGGVVAFIVVVAVVIIAIVVSRGGHSKPHDFTSMLQSARIKALLGGSKTVITPREMKRSNIKTLNLLGKGNFGNVNKGLVDEPHRPEYIVAVKTIHPDAGDSARKELLQEAAIMAQFKHPNIVGFVGVVTVNEPVMLVVEFCEFGSLNSYLSRNSRTTEVQRIHMASDCAQGLAYLASLKFVHRDVASRNVLLNSENRCKISDFGMSRDMEDSTYYHSSKRGALPVRWTAPEALETHKFSEMSDVWSFGVLMYEIWTNASVPYKGWNHQKVWTAVTSGATLQKPVDCPNEVFEVMSSCWEFTPQMRPRFKQLQETITELLDGKVGGNLHRPSSRQKVTGVESSKYCYKQHGDDIDVTGVTSYNSDGGEYSSSEGEDEVEIENERGDRNRDYRMAARHESILIATKGSPASPRQHRTGTTTTSVCSDSTSVLMNRIREVEMLYQDSKTLRRNEEKRNFLRIGNIAEEDVDDEDGNIDAGYADVESVNESDNEEGDDSDEDQEDEEGDAKSVSYRSGPVHEVLYCDSDSDIDDDDDEEVDGGEYQETSERSVADAMDSDVLFSSSVQHPNYTRNKKPPTVHRERKHRRGIPLNNQPRQGNALVGEDDGCGEWDPYTGSPTFQSFPNSQRVSPPPIHESEYSIPQDTIGLDATNPNASSNHRPSQAGLQFVKGNAPPRTSVADYAGRTSSFGVHIHHS
eukprot:m.166535 g.166535  ORF g.166535 m.166535 type:complete len:2195 (+) comp13451_c0_seq2:195-6779(+)